MKSETRREFFKQSLAVPAVAALAANAGAAEPEKKPVAKTMPQGKIGDLSISRILLGGNLLTHYTHSRDLKYVYNLCAHYNTDEKILETLALSEQHGINTLMVHTVPTCLSVLRKHRRERGGKMQWIICPTAPVTPGMEEYRKQCQELADDGTEAIYLWGVRADQLLGEGKIDLIAKAVDVAKTCGVPSGVGAHDLRVIEACEKNKIPADFYIKTFHSHNYATAPRAGEAKEVTAEVPGYWCKDPQAVIDVMKNVEKPWFAFKVMAAGAIPPKDAFQYAFENGADHVLSGMFDFEIEEDAAIARDVLAHVNRPRPWRS